MSISETHHVHLASSVLGKGTLTARHRLWMGPMTFEVEVEHRMRRQVAIYFSIVRRKACWASLVSLSTSVSKTTESKSMTIMYYSLQEPEDGVRLRVKRKYLLRLLA